MNGTRKFFSILTALALCLSLLPGTAWAVEGEAGVSINNSPLVNGKQYVAGGSGVVEKTADTPADTPYLEYSDGVLTVHGQMDLNSRGFRIVGDVTFTGGEGSCLKTGDTHLADGTLTLSGSVDFKPQGLSGNYLASPANKLTTTNDYSGDIAIQYNSATVLLDVRSSASISIGGTVNYPANTPTDPMTLKSSGNISLASMFQYHTVTIEGKNVSLESSSPVFQGNLLTITAEQDVTIESSTLAIMGAAEVSAGGDVEITSGSTLVSANPTNSLTVRNAKSVSIQGNTNEYNTSLLTVPVTFENCGNVTVTDNGTGEILKEGITVTSDKPWTAKTGNKTVTIPSGSWNYGGEAPQDGLVIDNPVAVPTAYKAGEGWAFYEPPAGEGSPAKLTLDNATCEGIIGIDVGAPVSVVAKGENRVGGAVLVIGSVTVDETNGTLNTFVGEGNEDEKKIDYAVYGKVELPLEFIAGENPDPDGSVIMSLTVRPGAELTIPSNMTIEIKDLEYFDNKGSVVNNGTVTLTEDAAASATSETIKGLKLTGSGSVTVEKENPDGGTATETYTNSGTKLLDPAGTLNLSSATNTGDTEWTTQGYKWEVTGTDSVSGAITSAKLTLNGGFNATTVTLPDAAVTIETEGESRIGTLSAGSSPNNAKLTFSGTGKLTITEHIEICNGDGNTLTVEKGANVEVNGGITIGASGAVNSLVTVNGTLTIAQGEGVAAINTGKVQIGSLGHLKVTGVNGIKVNGNPSEGSDTFKDAFVIERGGIFDAECSEYNIMVSAECKEGFPEGIDLKTVIRLPESYLSDGYTLGQADGKGSDSMNHAISITNDPDGLRFDERGYLLGAVSGKFLLHENHTWSSAWTADGDNGHYHACTFEGCTAKNDERPHYYAHGSTACRDCGHTRPAGTPDSDGGSSGGGGGGTSRYTVTVEKASHGEVTSSRRTASRGDTVTLTVTPDSGYALNTLTVTDSRGNEVALTEKGGGAYTFTMPSRAVTVRAAFLPLPDDTNKPCDGGADCPSRAFSDLDTSKWYHQAVDYVLRNNLMCGYGGGLFGPDDNLTRAQFTQILYNKAGRPVVNYLLQYNDVADGAWYTEAVRWAASQGIVSGYGNGMFGPNDNITREQLAVMLWRYAGSPAASDGTLAFTDADAVSEYALEALCWAVENGIVTGRGGGVLDPQGQATRAEAAAMLMRYLGK